MTQVMEKRAAKDASALTDPIKILAQEPQVDDSSVADAVREAGLEVQAVDWLWQQVTGSSLVEDLVQPITGDFDQMDRYAARWQNIADALTAVHDTMDAGRQDLRNTWQGEASDAFNHLISHKWEFAIQLDAKAAELIKKILEKVSACSRDACEKVLTLLKTLIDKLLSAIALLPIPVVGWARAVNLVISGLILYNAAQALVDSVKKVIETAIDLIKTIMENGVSLSSITGARELKEAIAGDDGAVAKAIELKEWKKKTSEY